MASRITGLVLDCAGPDRLAAFWCDVLGYQVLGRRDEYVGIGAAGGEQPTIVFMRNGDARRGKLPLHIDVNATDREQPDEPRAVARGAARPADVGQTARSRGTRCRTPRATSSASCAAASPRVSR